jgi:hypothetical protein
MADIVLIPKTEVATTEQIAQVKASITKLNATAKIIQGRSPVGNSISLKVDIPPIHRVSQYSGGECSTIFTKRTTLNLACGELYSGCPLCAAPC